MVNKLDIDDPEAATRQYESLRANALGELAPAPYLTLFLRSGMSSWLYVLTEHRDAHCSMSHKPHSAVAKAESKIPGTELSSILADAILNASGSVRHLGACG